MEIMNNERRNGRRNFLIGGAALAGAALIHPVAGWTKNDGLSFADDPFSLGVASGDPWESGVVLWTRLAPDPLNGGGMPAQPVPVKWEVATDDRMQKVVAKGTAMAEPAWGHSVHVEVSGLKPARWYWYRFTVDAGSSSIGRTRTAPETSARNDQFRFAFASCQHYETGFYAAYRHMSDEDLDLVIHLGDYIYEGRPVDGRVRKHNSPEIKSLDDYRNRYALYKSDPLLRRAHESFPWALVWDDHEVDNNYAGLIAEDNAPVEEFAARRARAYQVYYEHMPLRKSVLRGGGGVEIYRRLTYGNLAGIYMLDTRQYRTDQPCGDGRKPACPESLDERGSGAGEVADAGDGPFRIEMEHHRSTGHDGAGRRRGGSRAAVLDGSVERIRGGEETAALVHPGSQAVQSRGPDRRHPLELGLGSEARFQPRRFSGRGDGVRRHFDLIGRRRSGPASEHPVDAVRESAHQVLQRAARVRQVHRRQEPVAGRLPDPRIGQPAG